MTFSHSRFDPVNCTKDVARKAAGTTADANEMKRLLTQKTITLALALALAGCASTGPAQMPTDGVVSAVPTSLESAVRWAQTQRANGDFDGAMRTLAQLILVAPDDPRVLGEYGKTLVDKGETDDALAFLHRAAGLQPEDWSLFSA